MKFGGVGLQERKGGGYRVNSGWFVSGECPNGWGGV